MPNRSVRIEEMHLRIPGGSRDDARRLGGQVAQQLAKQLPEFADDRRIGALHLRLNLPGGAPSDHLAAAIAKNIARGIG